VTAGATHFRLDPDEVSPGRGAFLMAFVGVEPVGCGAVRLLNAFDAEVKRMYVKPEARRRGVAKCLLAALEAEAVGLGATRLLLETGVRQQEAIGLYRGAGFTGIEPFGEYLDSALSICRQRNSPADRERISGCFVECTLLITRPDVAGAAVAAKC
jgi:putative acetyltransferase